MNHQHLEKSPCDILFRFFCLFAAAGNAATSPEDARAAFVRAGGRGFADESSSAAFQGTLNALYQGGSGFGSNASITWSWTTSAESFVGSVSANGHATSAGNPNFPADTYGRAGTGWLFPTMTFERAVRYTYKLDIDLEVEDPGFFSDSYVSTYLQVGEATYGPDDQLSGGVESRSITGVGCLQPGTYPVGLFVDAYATGHTFSHEAMAKAEVKATVNFEALPALRGVFLGSTHSDRYGLPMIDGGGDVDALRERLGLYCSYCGSSQLYVDYTDSTPELNNDDILAAIRSEAEQLEDGDLFVFYYTGHGGGGVGMDEQLQYSIAAGGGITDDTLTQWFSGPEWDNINKLFILDSCLSGGFLGGDDGAKEPHLPQSDLLDLPKSAVIAAATEVDESPDPEFDTSLTGTNLFGRGNLTRMLEKAFEITDEGYAIADLDGNGISFQELAQFVSNEASGATDYEGFIKLLDAPDDLPIQTFRPTAVYAATPDFQMSLSIGGEAVPEPLSASLLVAALSLLRHRARRIERTTDTKRRQSFLMGHSHPFG